MSCADRPIEILRESGADADVVAHCRAVAGMALRICPMHPGIDRNLVEAGALLHDVGRARTHGIRHGLVGAAMLRELGCEEALVLIAERHVGAGITAKEAAALGLPERDYMPVSLEEKVVAHADNLVSGTRHVGVHECMGLARTRLPPPSLARLVTLHFEVFPPVEVSLPTGVEVEPDAVADGLDALARVKIRPRGRVVEFSGFEAAQAAERARAAMGGRAAY